MMIMSIGVFSDYKFYQEIIKIWKQILIMFFFPLEQLEVSTL